MWGKDRLDFPNCIPGAPFIFERSVPCLNRFGESHILYPSMQIHSE